MINYPAVLSQEEIDYLKRESADYCLAHGILMRPNELTIVPYTLFPSPFPDQWFKEANRIQPIFNALFDNVSQDSTFLLESLASTCDQDEFTSNLVDLFKGNTNRQPIKLGIHRSDYMLDTQTMGMKQIEFNTISSSFSSLSSSVSELHRFMTLKTKYFSGVKMEQLPLNNAKNAPVLGIAKAWELYDISDAIVLFVVQKGEGNIVDQRQIEYALSKSHGIRVERATLEDVSNFGKLKGDKQRLFYKDLQVAIVYFRAGYTPNDYPTSREWESRRLIENSWAIKCPPIEYHLAGTKKIQQVLASPEILKRFLKDQEHVDSISKVFTGLYPLDDSDAGKAALAAVLKNPASFVLKPQREGGGNNVYGEDIPKFIQSLKPGERQAYILMDLISPPSFQNIIARKGQYQEGTVISELGIYGVFVTNGSIVHMNEACGHLLRTKSITSHEGGVAAGFGGLDSPLLT